MSCIGEPFFVHLRKAEIMAGRHSAKRILARLFLRYAPEMRTEKTLSAAAFSWFAHGKICAMAVLANLMGCA